MSNETPMNYNEYYAIQRLAEFAPTDNILVVELSHDEYSDPIIKFIAFENKIGLHAHLKNEKAWGVDYTPLYVTNNFRIRKIIEAERVTYYKVDD